MLAALTFLRIPTRAVHQRKKHRTELFVEFPLLPMSGQAVLQRAPRPHPLRRRQEGRPLREGDLKGGKVREDKEKNIR